MKKTLITLCLATLVCAAVAATAGAARGHWRIYQFRGELQAVTPTSLELKVEGGNHAALRAMLGQSQDQTFTLGATTEILVWAKGVPTVSSIHNLNKGDWVRINVRAAWNESLADIEAKTVGLVGDTGSRPVVPALPLYLYVGTVAGPQSGGHIALTVNGGNRRALHRMIGEAATQTFTYDDNTIFLLWQGKVPTVIDASQLKAGDRITIRIRAPFRASLAQVEATPAVHVGDHEPPAGATPLATS
jgi:outer membrane lipoprotein SlyB